MDYPSRAFHEVLLADHDRMLARLWDDKLDPVASVHGRELAGLVQHFPSKDTRLGRDNANPDQFGTAVSEPGAAIVYENLDVVRVLWMEAASQCW
jgi:hypothetical protein